MNSLLITAQEVAGLNPAEVTYKQRAHVKWVFFFTPPTHKKLTKQPIFQIKKAPLELTRRAEKSK